MVLKSIRNNDNIVILKVDKGGATMVMYKEDYNSNMRDHLYSSESYKKFQKNPISLIIKEVKQTIKESNLEDSLKKEVNPVQ